jgi:hypothetical protein
MLLQEEAMYTAAEWPIRSGSMRLQGKHTLPLQDFSHIGVSGLNERKQIGIDFVCVNDRHSMRKAWVDLELRIFHQLGGKCSGI